MQSLWMLFASFMFAIMGVCVKLASDLYSTFELVAYRGTVGVVFILILIRVKGGSLKTYYPWHHLLRGTVGVIALLMWFYAISKLPLATAITLNYTAPIWIAAILFAAGLWQGQRKFEWGLTTAIIMSFLGITLLLQPAFKQDQWLSGMVGLGSGLLSALAYLQVKKLGHMGEPEYRVVFYFSVMGIIAGALGTMVNNSLTGSTGPAWHAHTGTGIALLLGTGLTATMAQIAMTRAYRLGNTLVTANLQYTGIIFSSLWGILIWDDQLSWIGWFGIAMILVSGLAATYYNTRNAAAAAVAKANKPIAT